jgi:hypothetical protein
MKIFAAILMLLWCSVASAETAQVIEGVRAKLRSGDGENYRTLSVLPASTEVEVTEAGQEFTKVKTQDGQIGWIKSSLLQPVRPAPAPPSAPVVDTGSQAASAVEAAQKDLLAAREQLIKMQSELEQERARTKGEPQIGTLALIALAAFAMGMAIGALLLRAYYFRRLHGLRI